MSEPLTPIGAWTLWQAQITAGIRSPDTVDDLFHAAMCESCALDAMDDKLPRLASMWFAEATVYLNRMAARAA